MSSFFQNIPLFRITVALVIGILIANAVDIDLLYVFPLLAILLFSLIFLKLNYNYKLSSFFGIVSMTIFVIIGILIFNLYNTKPKLYEKGTFVVTILEKPVATKKSYKTLGEIKIVIQDQNKYSTKEKILVYFNKDNHPDSLRAGDVIIFTKAPKRIINSGNPFEFDYAEYLAKKRIYRNVYLNDKDWHRSNLSQKSLKILAENTREKLLNIYRRQQLGSIQFEILSALTLGYKREIDPEIQKTFINCGAIHVLAVSGLHVSIIILLITLFFGFLRKSKFGKILFLIISIISLWIFAFITGLSPSVSRAATMFTILSIGLSFKRDVNIYNSLLISAFLLLLFNPNNLFNIGFQLSYSAVFGIVFLQPKFSSILLFKYKLSRYLWELITLSVSAQIATFPITSYYFNIFPTYFALTNIIIIPAITILIPMGILLLAVNGIPYLSSFVKFILENTTGMVYKSLQIIENFPTSTISIVPNQYQFLLIIAFVISILFFVAKNRKILLKCALTCMILLLCMEIYITLNTFHQRIVIVYNSKNHPLQLIAGKKNYIISHDEFNLYPIQNTIRKLRLDEPLLLNIKENHSDENIIIKNQLILFDTLLIDIDGKGYNILEPNDKIHNNLDNDNSINKIKSTNQAIYLKLN